MSSPDREYFRQRAAEEREIAESSPSEMVANIHLELAAKYDQLADQWQENPIWPDWANPQPRTT